MFGGGITVFKLSVRNILFLLYLGGSLGEVYETLHTHSNKQDKYLFRARGPFCKSNVPFVIPINIVCTQTAIP